MNEVSGLLVVLFAASIFKCCENTHNFQSQCFQIISDKIHEVLAEIFSKLQLSKKLEETDRFRLLWTLHANLNSKAQNYFKIYLDIVNASKVDNKTVNSLATLNNVIEEMAREENILTVYNSTDTHNSTGQVASQEASMVFISDFSKQFDNFTIVDILTKAIDAGSYNLQSKQLKSRRKLGYKRRRKNLMLWREYEYFIIVLKLVLSASFKRPFLVSTC